LEDSLAFRGGKGLMELAWEDEKAAVNFSCDDMHRALLELDKPIWVVEQRGNIGLAIGGKPHPAGVGTIVLGFAPALPLEMLGDPLFAEPTAPVMPIMPERWRMAFLRILW